MMSLSAPFISRPIGTSLLMIAVFLSGLLSFKLLPISSLPEVDYPTIQISTFYPGASPDVIKSTITAPLERQLGQMPGLVQMTSNSSTGSSIITLQFTLALSIDVAEQEVQAAINAASSYLPVNLPNPPIYNKVNPADTPIITLALTSDTLAMQTVEDYADTRLVPKLSQLSGVGLVNISGGNRPAVHIEVNPTALASNGLSLENLRALISAANVNAAKGSLDGPALAYTINTNDQLLTSNDYRPLIIAYRNNNPLRLSDIANVVEGSENTMQAAWMNEKPAIIINIKRQPGANIIKVADHVKQLINGLQTDLPKAIKLTLLTDRTLAIQASINEVEWELLLAVMLVIVVIYLFLNDIKSTLIPSISVPLSLVGTLGLMYLLGFSLNNLTLMALIIAAGFVVDDAIVMIENITRFIEAGDSPITAALKGSAQIGFTILSLTLSLIAVLIPLLFMGDVIGRLFQEFALTLTITILMSAFVSLTLTPMLCAQLMTDVTKKPNRPTYLSWFNLATVIERYSGSLRKVLAYQPLMLGLFAITMGLTALLFIIIPKGFFPTQDSGFIQAISQMPGSISFSAMAKRQNALAQVVLADPAVASISSFIGIDGTNVTLNSGRMLINLKPLHQRSNLTQVLARLEKNLAQVDGAKLYLQPVQDLNIDSQQTRSQYQYTVSSPTQADVNIWYQRLLAQLKRLPAVKDVTCDQQNDGLVSEVMVDRDTASRLSLTMQAIDDTLYDAFGQRQISIMFTQRNQYRVILSIMPKYQQSSKALDAIYFNPTVDNTAIGENSAPITGGDLSTNITNQSTATLASANHAIPLSAIAQIKPGLSPLLITTQDQFPVATLSFNLNHDASLGEAINAIKHACSQLALPMQVQTSFQGLAKLFDNSLANQGLLLLAAVMVVYIVLGVLYESYIHPLTILSTLPSACLGALLALVICHQELTIISLIAIILLVGLVMKNAIMMIDFALEQQRQYQVSAIEAIINAAQLRFRPIIMTTVASLFGAIPLAMSFGIGAELRRPLGIAIVGGLLLSQLLTLYSTPVIYLAFDNLARRSQRIRSGFLASSTKTLD